MPKFSIKKKLTDKEEHAVLLELCQALVVVRTLYEAAHLLADLLSQQELNMIAKRLKIAKLLLKGMNYEEIQMSLKVSTQTIARVNLWLRESGEGYRLIVEKTKGNKG